MAGQGLVLDIFDPLADYACLPISVANVLRNFSAWHYAGIACMYVGTNNLYCIMAKLQIS